MEIDVVQLELSKKYKIEIDSFDGFVYGVDTAKDVFIKEIGKSNVEMVGLLCLDSTNKVINYCNLSIGNIENVQVSIAQVLKVALLSNSSKIIIAHNHPSNVLEVTKYDLDVTKNIAQAAKLFNIELIDSLIINMDCQVISIREKMKELKC